ncbi:uncharacterized protein LOC122506152 [Leptopilina heterotoma]|uniref:uncharacterized protein LOC122506152 n=1 Tax=Leptopilina heterotoma TaxID=63436 RepID=UPI001CA8FB7F|nr:uncharacterized protein LOC122506152 [Leptopilina heterotoma]XP_043474117.1 uncharacterized protein LOC122506152 [Leptopilina heterotoma]
MIRIAIVCFLISYVNCLNCSSEINVSELREALKKITTHLKTEVQYEDGALFISSARAGKSTLINYLLGNTLISSKRSKYDSLSMILPDKNVKGPEIDAGPVTKTTILSRWTSPNLTDLSLWDSPGFSNDKNRMDEIMKALSNIQLMKNVKSLKFVLVINTQDILNDYSVPFLSLLNDVANFFGNKIQNFLPSMSFIFSRAPHILNQALVDRDFINYLLHSRYLNIDELQLPSQVKEILSYITKNNNQIGLFKKLNRAGVVTSDFDDNISGSIKTASSVNNTILRNIRPYLSTETKTCLYETKAKLLSPSEFNDSEQDVLQELTENLLILLSESEAV